jgi:hypothetical protein
VGLGDGRRRALRIRIRDVLLRHGKRLSVERAGWMADAILEEIGREPLGTLDECPIPNCACWMCVLRLHAEVLQHQAMLQVEREAEEEVD